MPDNALYYGDNLDILRRYVADESVDLIYLDPPFNSKQAYNVLFEDDDGAGATSQTLAFGDTWHWTTEAMDAYEQVLEYGGQAAETLRAFRGMLGDTDMMAYLAMMSPRLIELRRVLRDTGSIYLHCDPTASHYLKVIMDAVFGGPNFVNEVVWKRTTTKSDYRQGATNWPRIHDTLLHYQKNYDTQSSFHQPFAPYSQDYVDKFYRHEDEDGRLYTLDKLTAPGSGTRGHPQYELLGVTRYWVYGEEKMERLLAEGRIVQTKPGNVPRYKRYLDEVQGVAIGDIWEDIRPLSGQAKERLGYPTQKPEALLERIIEASSDEGDVVLDPFCGCGTTVAVARRLKRDWIGIDITHIAVNLMKTRLRDTFGEGIVDEYEVIGEPTSLGGAKQLAEEDRYQFESWALGLVGARPTEKKRGADKGIDGRLYFRDGSASDPTRQIVISVKSGHVGVSFVRDLRGVLDREEAELGLLITLEPPTKPMVTEAASAGFYHPPHDPDQKYAKLQILTIEDLFEGGRIDCPYAYRASATFKRAPKAQAPKATTDQMDLER